MDKCALTAVIGSVGNLAVKETSLLCGVDDEIGFLKADLARLQGYLQDAHDKRLSGIATMATWVRQIREAAEDAENVVEVAEYMEKRNRLRKGFVGAITRYARLPRDVITRHKVGVEIQRIKRNISEIMESMRNFSPNLGVDPITRRTEDEDDKFVPPTIQDDMIVGFEDQHEQIVEMLLHKEEKLTAVFIVGMGGAGKTAIARKIYSAPEIEDHFKVAAWVSLPQNFRGIDILKDIYKQITVGRDGSREIDHIREDKVGEKIYEILLQNRYLIVLDGVWDADTWDKIDKAKKKGKLVRAFPDANNGSRVMITTRNLDVATHMIPRMLTSVHALRLLDEEEAWELFSNVLQPYKSSEKRNHLNEFEDIGRKIARKCSGLPLALVVLGKYLAMNLNIQTWMDVLQDWTTVTTTKVGQLMQDILARSYNDLPNQHLKSCFLYIAAFPKDYVISVSDLIKLWIAEGFIPHTTTHGPEKEARKYVAELAKRSLVQVVSTSKAQGWIEEIQVHDILGEWCIEEARNDGFLDVVHKTTHRADATPPKISFQNSYDDRICQRILKLRTLLGFNCQSMSLPKLRFLRVIHIEDSSLKNFSASIVRFIHLRYIRLRRCKGVVLVSSIGQLLYLQTIDLRGTKLGSTVPHTLWDIPGLRHVYLEGEISVPRKGQQKELQTLHLNMEHFLGKFIWSDAMTFWRKMTLLTTLELRITPMDVDILKILEHMPHLVEVFLYRFNVLDKLPESQSFPQSLRQLHLFANVLKKDPMPVLEKLPSLVVLELWGYNGQDMTCSAHGFPLLQMLTLRGFFIDKWEIEVKAMPSLSHLALERGAMPSVPKPSVLDTATDKKTILPTGLLHLLSLKELRLVKMPPISSDPTCQRQLIASE